MASSSGETSRFSDKETPVADPAPVIDPADYHHAVETLKALLAFRLMVSRDAPDRGMEYRFVHDAVEVMRTVEKKYEIGHGGFVAYAKLTI